MLASYRGSGADHHSNESKDSPPYLPRTTHYGICLPGKWKAVQAEIPLSVLGELKTCDASSRPIKQHVPQSSIATPIH